MIRIIDSSRLMEFGEGAIAEFAGNRHAEAGVVFSLQKGPFWRNLGGMLSLPAGPYKMAHLIIVQNGTSYNTVSAVNESDDKRES